MLKEAEAISIRKQLLRWVLLPLCLLWIITTAFAYFLAIEVANAAYDREILNTEDSVASRLKKKKKKISVDLPPAAIAILRHNGREKLYYQVIDTDGTRISGDTLLPGPFPKLESNEPMFRNARLNNNRDVRIARMRVEVPNYPKNEVFVQVAETLENRQYFTGQILLSIIVPELILIIFGALAVSLGVTRGLVPLKNLAEDLSNRSKLDLTSIPVKNAPVEVRPLVIALNELFERLKLDLEFQQRFVANAAHKLRTPLAGLKTYIYSAKKLPSDSRMNTLLDRIESSTDRMSRLANQLLTLAKAEPANKIGEYNPLDLNLIASEVTADFVSEAMSKNLDLSFEGATTPAVVRGNPTNLAALTSNLIDNAILYTQSGGTIVVRVVHNGHVSLAVQDNGPGIPEEEQERVFERFYRVLGTEAPGSGLGLAIVKEIAQAHDADISLETQREHGTKISVTFPRP